MMIPASAGLTNFLSYNRNGQTISAGFTSLNALDALDHLTPSWSDRYALAEFISLPRLLINYLILPICEETVKLFI
jgi:hypothetical protein